MDIIARKFAESLFRTSCTILTSPYKNNNLFVILDLNDSGSFLEIYRYIYDTTEPEIRFFKKIELGQELKSAMGAKIKVDFILPGKNINELIVFCQKGNVWKALIRAGNQLTIRERIGKIVYEENKEDYFSIFDLFNPLDMVAYFTKITKEFACLVIKENNSFYLALNNLLFSKVNIDNSIIEFEDSQAYWNSTANNLDIFSFNYNSGLSYIYFPKKRINQPIPLSIINLKKIEEKPIDVCCIEDSIYSLDTTGLKIFPNFKKYKLLNLIPFQVEFDIGWFEPQFEICKILCDEGFFDLIITPTMDKIHLNKIKVEGKNITRYSFDSEFIYKSLGNRQVSIISKQANCHALFKQEHVGSLKTHKVYLHEFRSPIPDVKESLRKLEELELIDMEALVIATRAKLPKALISLNKRRRRSYSKEEDLYIINNAYGVLTMVAIGKELKRSPMSIYQRIKTGFGTPTCENHSSFDRNCSKCNLRKDEWKLESIKLIENKIYPIVRTDKSDIDDVDIEIYLKQQKKSRFRRDTIYFRKILPSQLYEKIIDFIIDSNLTKGRSLRKLFEQSLLVFINDYLNNLNIDRVDMPFHLLELYFDIKPEFKWLKHVQEEYKKLINKDYHPLGDIKFLYKDALILQKIYIKEVYEQIIPKLNSLYALLRKETKQMLKEGFLAAIIYISLKNTSRRKTQEEISTLSDVTEVTLRTRINEISEYLNYDNEAHYIGHRTSSFRLLMDIQNHIQSNLTIQDLIIKREFILNQFIGRLEDLIVSNKFESISEQIRSFKLQENDDIELIMPTLQKISRIEMSSIIYYMINFLIKYDIKSEEIFNNYIKFIISENTSLRRKVRKYINYHNPDFEGLNLFSIIDIINIDQKKSIFKFLQGSLERAEKFQTIKNYIQKQIEQKNYVEDK